MHPVSVVRRHTPDDPSPTQQFVPIDAVVGVPIQIDGATGIPQFHRHDAVEKFKIPYGGAAPLGVAVDDQIVVGHRFVHVALKVVGVVQVGVGQLFVMVKAVLLVVGADGHGVEVVLPPADVPAAIHLHGGDDQQIAVGEIILPIVAGMIGNGEKVVAVVQVQLLHRGGATLAVGAGGVAVQTALEHLSLGGKGRLPQYVVTHSLIPPFRRTEFPCRCR